MPITYPIDFPSYLISNFEMGLRVVVPSVESPFTLEEQVYRYSGEVWQIDVQNALLPREDAEAFNAFILKLGGKWGRFTISDPNGRTPRGSWGGTPLVNGAGQTGNDLNIDGLPAGVTGVAKAGDYIQIGTGLNTRLHKVLDDANSNGSGQASLLIAPRLRSSPADNAPIITTNAKGLFRLSSNYNPFKINSNSFYNLSFSAREAL